MAALVNLYRRLDLIQRTQWFRIAASVGALVICAAYFGPLLVKSHDLHAQRILLGQALAGQNLNDGDEHALSLRESGTVTVGERTWGGPDLARRAVMLFDEEGTIVAPARLAEQLVADQRPTWAPRFLLEQPGTTWLLATTTVLFLLLVVWMKVSVAFVLTVLGTALPVGVSWLLGWEQAMLALAGMGLLTFTFVLLTRAVLIAFQFPNQTLAVAHTVVKEASRSRLSLVFVILLLVGLPLLPIWLDPDAPLRFRVQTFIARSLGMTYSLAACMTLFLACATVAFEIRDRQIWQLMTKPVGRFNYLLGKWIGVLSVNAVILVVAGVSIFFYVQYLRGLPVAPGVEGVLDRLAVQDEVLTARIGARPRIEGLSPAQLRGRVEQMIERDPQLAGLDEVPLAVKRRLARELQESYIESQRSIPPINPDLLTATNYHTYVFGGLGKARELQSALTLRYRFHILRDDEHETFPARFMFNEDPDTITDETYIPTVTQRLYVGTDLIRDDGTMSITVINLFITSPELKGRGELNFEAEDFELLYKVASFEANFFRAVVITWIKLGFLAMLGIAASTLLSFPVACLLSFTIFAAGTLGPFLAMSLEEYYPIPASQMDWTDFGMVLLWAAKSFIRVTAVGLVYALGSFSEYQPTQSLVQGRLISWGAVARGIFWLGVVWSGAALVVGFVVLRRRQLAIYSGHG